MAGDNTSLSGLAGRYASALFELADDKQQLDGVAEELKQLRALVDESADLSHLISSPVIARNQQAKAMAAILDQAGASDLTRRFVLVVANNRRLFALPQIITAYLAELSRRRGEVTAEVTSARPLTPSQEASLTETLRKEVGAKVQVDVNVDPSLLGGLVVKVGSRMIDSSLRTKLQKLQFAMKGIA